MKRIVMMVDRWTQDGRIIRGSGLVLPRGLVPVMHKASEKVIGKAGDFLRDGSYIVAEVDAHMPPGWNIGVDITVPPQLPGAAPAVKTTVVEESFAESTVVITACAIVSLTLSRDPVAWWQVGQVLE